jgi:3-mercaptopyruvate sulfurtransferase SseA
MKKTMTRSGYVAALLLCLFMAAPVAARELQPIVSTEWLAANLDKPGMVLLDIRKVEYYLSGHIPGAVNAFYSAWTVKKVDLYTEIPEMDDLFDLIGEAGIDGNSRVVIIGKGLHGPCRLCT